MAEPTGAIPTQPTPIPIFKGEGYDFWSIRMKTILRSRDLWDLVESGVNTADTNLVRLKTNQRRMLTPWLNQKRYTTSCSLALQQPIQPKKPGDIEDGVQGDEQVKAIKLQGLRRDFENLAMKEEKWWATTSHAYDDCQPRRRYGDM
ncbi:hypothetical protein R6Q59_025304 [Mikania micrantha]